MAIKLCFQAGHFNKAGGGAPEEQANNKRIVDRLSAMMRDRGFEVYQTDWYANNDPKVTGTDYSLFLALHCDMDYPNDNGSGFADYPDPSTDGATAESQRICAIVNDVYFKESGIKYVSHSNANTRYYYMWKWLTAKTPCVLLEMGQSIDPHDRVLLANTDLIASSIARALCKAFNVSYDLTPQPSPEDVIAEKDKQIQTLQARVLDLEKSQKDLADRVLALESNIEADLKLITDWQSKYESANKALDNANKSNQELIAEKNQYKKWYETKCDEIKKLDKMTAWQHIKYGISLLTVKK